MTRKLLIILILIAILAIAGGAYYWFFMRGGALPQEEGEVAPPTTFNPFSRSTVTPTSEAVPSSSSITEAPAAPQEEALQKLRQLSATPVGGFMASSTASSTVVRYIDRGIGHVYEVKSISPTIEKISNTTIPRVYESYWNKNLSAAVIRYTRDEADSIVNFYADIRHIPTTASGTPDVISHEIKGKFLSPTIEEVAVSPKGDRIFTLNREGSGVIGYVSGFDESKKTKVLDTPLTQLNAEWPEENTVAISTKSSGASYGYLYLLDLKQLTFKKIIGDITGLSAKVSPDLQKVIFSSTGSRGFTTSLLSLKDNSIQEVIFRTTADKCVWSKFSPNEVYCAVPTEIPPGIYPDDWYRGNVSFVDQIWHLDTTTGEVHLIANLIRLSNGLIDATNLTLDPKDNFLYFINKRDLTLWSLDLNK